MSSWERGYGDFVLRPDLATLRLVPWHEGTAMVLGRHRVGRRGGAVPVSPRQVLRRQLDRLAERGLAAYVGTELEFIVFDDSYEEAWQAGYRELTPANQYNVDYSMLGTGAAGTAAAPHPQRHDRRRPVRRVGQGRVQPRPARDRVPLRRTP